MTPPARLRPALILLALPLAALTASADPAPAGGRPHPFKDVVAANFSKWDKNRDGKLAATEATALVNDPHLTGDEAAAVAAVHASLKTKGAPPAVTLAELTNSKAVGGGRRDVEHAGPRYAADYHDFAEHLRAVPRVLFGDGAPALDGIQQGQQGDCYFISAVGAAAHRDANNVKGMFRPQPDGSVVIAFPGHQTVRVPKLTDAQIALGARAGRQGLWVNYLEVGFGMLTVQTPRARRANDAAIDTIGRGGDADETILLLTGHKGTWLPIRKGNGLEPPPAAELPAAEARLHALFQAAARVRGLVCAGTSKGKLPPGVVTNHDYAVVGYDAAARVVSVWNPWGHEFTPKAGPPGLQNGYPVRGGRFTVPLAEFVRVFEEVYYESAVPGVHR